jgi:hypothetical protein
MHVTPRHSILYLVLEIGKAQVLDVTAFSRVDWLLKENGDGAAPSVARKFDVRLLLRAAEAHWFICPRQAKHETGFFFWARGICRISSWGVRVYAR